MTDVVMPQMGESIVEGTLTKWLKKTGDRIERDEPLFEISTDKVDTEIPAPAAGTLSEILVQEGQTVGINTVVARIDESGGAAAKPAAASSDKAPSDKAASDKAASTKPAPVKPASAPETPPQEPSQPTPSLEQVDDPEPEQSTPAPAQPSKAEKPPEAERGAEPAGPLSPLVRKMARENNIDLGRVKGTGAGGRITKQDVEAYVAQGAKPAAPETQAAPAAQSVPAQPGPAQPGPAQPAMAPLPPAGQAKTRI